MVVRLAVAATLLCGMGALAARAQMPFNVPAAPSQDGAKLFAAQCGTCHTVEHGAAPRQGPNLAGVVGRRAGSLPDFKYSPAFAQADFTWDDARLDQWLTNPQALLPGAIMVYRQANPQTRKTIIVWLKEQR
jgi:cytochrome c